MKLKFLGVPIYMNGQNYYIPSLSVRDFQQYHTLLSQPPAQGAEESLVGTFNAFLPVIGAAIRRNYPDVTDDELVDWLDFTTYPLAIKAVQSASGLAPVAEGE